MTPVMRLLLTGALGKGVGEFITVNGVRYRLLTGLDGQPLVGPDGQNLYGPDQG